MSGKKVKGPAPPESKPKEKAPILESSQAKPKDESYGSPAYQDPGLCAGTAGVSLSMYNLLQ